MSDEEPADPSPPRKRSMWSRIFTSHDFARDLTVTALGVLIALGIGEIVEEIRWKFRVRAAEAAMEKELSLVNALYHEQLALEPCVTRRLSELSEILSEARRTGRLPDIQNISYPPDHGGAGDSWTITLGSEIPLHMDTDRLMGISTAWVNEDTYSANVAATRDGFLQLALMEHRPGPATDNVLTVLETALIKARNAEYGAWYLAKRDSEVLASFGIQPSFDPQQKWDEKQLQADARSRLLCQPLKVDGQPYQLKGKVIQYSKGRPDQPAPN
jgi:hypothetical protein